MEAVGLASGIAGLMTLTIQLGDVIHEYSSALKHKDETINELANEISTLGSALSEFNQSLKNGDQQKLKFDEDCVLRRAYLDCKHRIEKIGQVFLDTQNGSRFRRVWNTVKWPFKQKEVIQMIENLRRFTQVFNFAVNIRNCAILAQSSSNASEQLSQLQIQAQEASEQLKSMPEMFQMLQEDALKRTVQLKAILDLLPTLSQQADDIETMRRSMQFAEEREQRRLKGEILNWLLPNTGLPKHHELQRKRGENTCQWFLEHGNFASWAQGDPGNKSLLCAGGPGTGKTILCSIVIDHLQNLHAASNTAVLHYYCDFFEKANQTSTHFARSLLHQLVQSYKGIPTAALEFYRTTVHNMPDFMWLHQLYVVLTKVIMTFDRCFLILDAIDETDVREQRKSIFDVLNVIRGSKGQFRTLATSRPHIPDIELQFPDATPLEIGASSTDIYNFLNIKLNDSPIAKDILDDALRSEILSSLCEIAQGMFLLPALQIDHILDQVTTGGVRRALNNLSRTLPGVFRSTMQRIYDFPQAKRELAMKTLLWISHAGRTLTISELQHALAVHLDELEFHEDDIPSEKTIIESCCGLVELVGNEIDGEQQYVTFVHFSLQEFLSGEGKVFSEADMFITKTCLKYLSFESLQFIAQGNRKALLRTLIHYPFLKYASSFWGYHAHTLPIESYQDMALALFRNRDALFLAIRVRDADSPDDGDWERTTTQLIDSGSGGISIAASFGLSVLLKLLLESSTSYDLNIKNIYGSTPLHQCAISGSLETAQALIAHGADLLSVNKGGATPFYLAVAYDRIELCRFLLSINTEQLNKARNDGNTPLHKACECGTHQMVTLLVESGAYANAANDAQKCGKMTPLHLACQRGNLPVVHLLVNGGAKLETRNKDSCTALDMAATNGFFDIAQYLLENGASLNGKSRGGWTPLHRAARSGQVEVARLFLQNGANLLERDFRRCLPLTLATKQGNLDCVRLLLEYSPIFTLHQLQNLDIERESAKFKAYSNAHYDLYKYLRDLELQLLSNSATPTSITTESTSVLTHAIERGSLEDVVKLLDDKSDLLMSRDPLGQMPIHTAFVEQQFHIATELLRRGASIDARGYHDWTPLMIAASEGSYRMVTLALQHNADVHAVSNSNNDALHKAASAHSIEVFLELLCCGADPYVQNDLSMTALHVVAGHNFTEAARELLKPKWQSSQSQHENSTPLIFTKDKRGNTPRWWAERNGHLELADYLRFEERKARSGGKATDSRPMSSRRSTPLQPTFSRAQSMADSVTSISLSRSTTRMSLSTQATNTSLLSPPIGTSKLVRFPRRSTDSLFDHSDEGDQSEGMGLSPARTLVTPILFGERSFDSLSREDSGRSVDKRFVDT